MKILTILIGLLVTFCGLSEGIEVECEFRDFNFLKLACVAKNVELVTSRDDREVTEVKNLNKIGKNRTNDDVKAFNIHGDTRADFFPRGLTNFTKNLEYIYISNANMQEVTKEDLQEFGDNLKRLWLYGNEIEVIEADLFEYNRNLDVIDFHDNKIKTIETGAFDGLVKLHSFWINSNPCTGFYDKVDWDRAISLAIVKNVEEKCNPNFIVTTSKPEVDKLSLIDEKVSQISSIDAKLTSIEAKIDQHEKKVSTIERRFKSEFPNFMRKVAEKRENDKNELKNFIAAQNDQKFGEALDEISFVRFNLENLSAKLFEKQIHATKFEHMEAKVQEIEGRKMKSEVENFYSKIEVEA